MSHSEVVIARVGGSASHEDWDVAVQLTESVFGCMRHVGMKCDKRCRQAFGRTLGLRARRRSCMSRLGADVVIARFAGSDNRRVGHCC